MAEGHIVEKILPVKHKDGHELATFFSILLLAGTALTLYLQIKASKAEIKSLEAEEERDNKMEEDHEKRISVLEQKIGITKTSNA